MEQIRRQNVRLGRRRRFFATNHHRHSSSAVRRDENGTQEAHQYHKILKLHKILNKAQEAHTGITMSVAKKAKTGFDKKDTVHFDPTSIGLPENWSLTDFSDLKG